MHTPLCVQRVSIKKDNEDTQGRSANPIIPTAFRHLFRCLRTARARCFPRVSMHTSEKPVNNFPRRTRRRLPPLFSQHERGTCSQPKREERPSSLAGKFQECRELRFRNATDPLRYRASSIAANRQILIKLISRRPAVAVSLALAWLAPAY